MEEMGQEKVVVEKRPEMTEDSLGYLRSGAGWAQFISIVNFIFCGLAVLGGVMMAVMAFLFPAVMSHGGMVGPFMHASVGFFALMAVLYLGIGIVGCIMSYYLYKFSVDSKKAVLHRDTEFLTSGMSAMKKYFKLTGILMIITLVFLMFWVPIAFMFMPGM